MGEQTFFEEGDVTVTRSRIVIANRTYPVANITAIRTDTVPPNLMWFFLMGVFGVILLLVGINDIAAFLLGAAFIVAAVVAWRQAKRPTRFSSARRAVSKARWRARMAITSSAWPGRSTRR